MNVRLDNGSRAAQEDIDALTKMIGETLPADFLDFVAGNDGARPELNIFTISDDNHGTVTRFIPVREIPNEMSFMENLPDKAFPLAWDTSGNYVVLDQGAGGAVFFWDHELPRESFKLANSFGEFLEALEPFSEPVDSDAEVISVWVDPEFLKKYGKKSE